MIGIVASIVFAALVAFWRSRRRSGGVQQTYDHGYKRLLPLVAVTLVIGAVIFLQKTGSREEGNELSGREIIWPIEIASVNQHPVFGLGPFGDIQLLFFDERLPQVGAAHSDYLGAAVCYGIPGLLLFCGALYGVWRRILRYRAVSIEERTCRYAALFSLVGVSTTMIAENVIRDPRLFSLHLLFPALCLSAAASGRQKAAR
jgi:O-antigen ligase